MALDLFSLDRAIAATAVELRAERRRMAEAESESGGAAVISRSVSQKVIAEELSVLGAAGDRLALGLAAWVRFLSLRRVTSQERARVARSRVLPGEPFAASLAALLSGGPVPPLERDLVARAAPVREATARYLERLLEARRLLALPNEDELGLAERLIALSDGLVPSAVDSWSEPVRRALATDADGGWPVHLTPRWLSQLVEPSGMLTGVRLEPLRLPPVVGAASFGLALARLGALWAELDLPPGTPFVLVRAPNDRLPQSRAALLSSWLLEPSFHRKKLGLSREAAREQVRRIARASVSWLRIRAVAVVASPLLAEPSGSRDFEELTHRVLGAPWPGLLLAVLPRHEEPGGTPLRALLEAAHQRDQLRERFDEDWFDNPRAITELRHQHHLPSADRARLEVSDEALLALLGRQLREALGD